MAHEHDMESAPPEARQSYHTLKLNSVIVAESG